MAKEYITILHMSDFHFQNPKGRKRIIDQTLNSLVTKLIEMDGKTPIDVIVVSGDIAFSGKQNEYNYALDFFRDKLLEQLNEARPGRRIDIFMCAGNHDSVQPISVADIRYHRNKEYEASGENTLDQKNIIENNRYEHFRYFAKFCNDIKAVPLKNKLADEAKNEGKDAPNAEYLYGSATLKYDDGKTPVNFIVLNSAWDSIHKHHSYYESDDVGDKEKDEKDKGRMRIGEALFDEALSNLETDAKGNISGKVVLVFHHPFAYGENWFVKEEFTDNFELNRTECEIRLHNNINLVLNGHIHRDDLYPLRSGGTTQILSNLLVSCVGRSNPPSIPQARSQEHMNHCRIIKFPLIQGIPAGENINLIRKPDMGWLDTTTQLPTTKEEEDLLVKLANAEVRTEGVERELVASKKTNKLRHDMLFAKRMDKIKKLVKQIESGKGDVSKLISSFGKEVQLLFSELNGLDDEYATGTEETVKAYVNHLADKGLIDNKNLLTVERVFTYDR